jgi:hypothetical protein
MAKNSEPTFDEIKKEMDDFFADFDRKLNALKLDKKCTEGLRKSLKPTEEWMANWVRKNFKKDNPDSIGKLAPAAQQCCKKIPWVHVKPAPDFGNLPDGIKFSFGSKKFSFGFKLKKDEKTQKVKLEPVGTIKFHF